MDLGVLTVAYWLPRAIVYHPFASVSHMGKVKARRLVAGIAAHLYWVIPARQYCSLVGREIFLDLVEELIKL